MTSAPPRAPEPLNEAEAQSHLELATNCRYAQDSILWTIIGAFLGTNAVLLVALFSSGKVADEGPARLLPCAMGSVVSFVWLVMQAGALRRIRWYEGICVALQKQLGHQESLWLFPEPGQRQRPLLGPLPERGVSRLLERVARRLEPQWAPTARQLMPWLPWASMVGWLVGLQQSF